MSKRITLICALIGVVAFIAAPAYAEVQNIRVSGDITAMAVYRNNYDLEGKYFTEALGYQNAEDQDSFLMSVVRLRIDADLTDNVSACVRLANLRDWDVGTNDGGSDIFIDLANITLKEMLYSPLTLIIGRQELMYGNGLVIGPGLFHDPDNVITYNDLSPLHGYDAIRAVLDYDPWTLNLLLAKMEEADNAGAHARDNDVDLYGANLGYKFANYDAEIEGYFFAKRDANYDLTLVNIPDGPNDDRVFELNKVYTLGLRGSVVPRENLTLSAEIAGQLGEIYDGDAGANSTELKKDREALAVNVAGKYDFANVRFNPSLGLEYLYLSGEEANAENDGDFEAWDPMYRGKIMGTIRDCLESLYTTTDPTDTSGWTNQHTVKATGSLDLGELVDGLSLDLAYLHYWFAEEPLVGAGDDIGQELNMKLTYDYTEDVQFALDSAVFLPGDYYDTTHPAVGMENGGMSTDNTATGRDANDPAVSVIGSCKVTF